MKLLVLPGDGIGPEISAATVDVVTAAAKQAGCNLAFSYADIGFASLKIHGTTLTDDVFEQARDADGVILGPVSHNEYPPSDKGGLNQSRETGQFWRGSGMRIGLMWVALLVSACAVPSELSTTDRALIAGRTFVITGASSGVGQGAALKLASYGGNVVLAARRGDVLETVARQARAYGAQALAVPTDVSRPDEVQHLAEAAVARFGRIDAWINDAAVAAIGRFDEVPLEDHARVVDVNLKGYIFGSYAALRQFRRQGFGTLVNVSSIEAYVPLAYQASYAATKAGILALDSALIEELRIAGTPSIRVASVLPWAIDTPLWDHMANYSGGATRFSTMESPWPTVDAVV